ncbi:unnamed protein product [Arabidopsis halleri]
MKNHRNILLGFSVYLSAGTKLTIPPEAEQHIAPSDNNKRKRAKCNDPAMIKITSDNNKRKRAKCIDPAMIKVTSDNNKRKRAKCIDPAMIKVASDNTDNNKRKRAKCDDPDYDPDSEKKLKVYIKCSNCKLIQRKYNFDISCFSNLL